MPDTVSAVVVSYADPAAARAALESVRAQVDEAIVVDNSEDARFGTEDGVEVLRLGGNVGYTPACNAAAQRARSEWVLFLNPDAVAAPDLVERLLEGSWDGVAVLGAQVLLPDGERVNAGANPLHVSGLSWSGGYGEPREDGPPREVAGVSGAALMARRADYLALGGMCPEFFMYADDADICWRARIAGRRVVFCPRATVVHDYAFDQGARKWFLLERNRLWSVLSNYSARSLALLAPVLLATELGTLLVALRSGWAREKLRAWGDLVRRLGELRRWRRGVQAARRVGDRELLAMQTARMDSPLVSHPLLGLANPLLAAHVRVVGRWL